MRLPMIVRMNNAKANECLLAMGTSSVSSEGMNTLREG